MTAIAPRRATYADVLAVQEHLVAELIDGELVVHPRPANPHAAATTALGEELAGEHYTIRAVHAEDEKVRAVPFGAIELELSILWADVQLPPSAP